MSISRQCERLDVLAVLTWGLVFAIALSALPTQASSVKANTPFILACFLLYLVAFFGATKTGYWRCSANTQRAFLVIQLASAFAIMLMLPLDFIPILTIIWAGMLINFCRFSTALLVVIALVTVWFSLYGWRWQKDYVMFTGALYFTFHIFSLLTSQQTKKAQSASEQANELNRQLLATQQLLTQSTQQHERTRIARELHDLLGHHLTALTINLQVSSHLCEQAGNAEAKAKVDHSYALAKLLLSDVRDAVSTIKSHQAIDLNAALDALVSNVPTLSVHLDIASDLKLEHIELATTIVRICQEALTNTLRHTNATDFWLSVTQGADTIELTITDNGTVSGTLTLGNGLTGIKERAALVGGTASFSQAEGALIISAVLPDSLVSP
ncbi:sensor histidine kinase [Thalassotalea euphylliae]|uniref:Sensor histidine kinase n=1 Tax=Thalassotalea euphylliae TaxID=1655234 RepID=A0A3E0TLX1_9GAMM|nr:sensor histidine kinase [Thalassotalea euphylliae]